MGYKWMPIYGKMEENNDKIIFKGGKKLVQDAMTEREGSEIGLFICNQVFSEGTISVDVKFNGNHSECCADIVLFFNPQDRSTLNAGLGNLNFFSIRHFDKKWTYHAITGEPNSIKPQVTYHLSATLQGSTVSLKSDGIEVLRHALPYPLAQSQVGLFCIDQKDIEFSNFKIERVKPKAFVVMQFSSRYNDVYFEVIKNVCEKEEIGVLRIDEESGPGLIIQDIIRSIYESKFIIADISPVNANIFYEVGFAHALNKPTILIAEKGTSLPFDISSFRTLFYENTIGGKRKLEEGLTHHIRAILKQSE
ncbi:MAG: hypothetical protein EHM20_10325 [Alphaproteobacteria bacterium]|nr:MAG: hypothetical protein EHM20_10325 [Alphaproteobacteria bacterium]